MSNLFDDLELPPVQPNQQFQQPQQMQLNQQPPTPPNSTAATLRTCGIVALVIGLMFMLVITAGAIGFVMLQREMTKQRQLAEAKRVEAQQAAAKFEAEQRRQWAESQRGLVEEQAARAEQARAEAMRMQQERQEEQKIEREKIDQQMRERKRHAEMVMAEELEGQNFTEIVRACQRFYDIGRGQFVLPNGGEQGSGLSWRVHLLPHINQERLYLRFKLDEPWDSDHNKQLLQQMPSIFGANKEGKTRVRSFQNVDGKGWPFLTYRELSDGANETFALFLCPPDQPVEWTKPDDWELQTGNDSAEKLITALEKPIIENIVGQVVPLQLFMMCDRTLATPLTPLNSDKLRALVSYKGHEFLSLKSIGSQLQIESLDRLETPYVPVANVEEELKAAQAKIAAIGKAFQALRKASKDKPELLSQPHLLSWRVSLLPYLGEQKLYDQFKLDEPWDSSTNFALLKKMPEVYELGVGKGRTRFCIPGVGSNNPFTFSSMVNLQDDPDTATLFYYCGASRANYWTKPDTWNTSGSGFMFALGWTEMDPIPAGTYSGNSLLLPPKLHATKFEAFLSLAKGENFDVKAALAEPEKPLRLKAIERPAKKIEGAFRIPKVPAVKVSVNAADKINRNDAERLSQVAMAVHNFESAFRQSPCTLRTSTGEASGLSWRVHLLPFLDQKLLYEKFALDEPWDSKTNIAAAAMMPEIYGATPSARGKADICVVAGEGSLLSTKRWMNDCTDSLNNTMMLIQVGDAARVPWTKPDDVEVSQSFRMAQLRSQKPYVLTAMGDGSILPLPTKLPEEIFVAMATTRGGELLDAGTVRRLSYHALGMPIVTMQAKRASEDLRLKTIAEASLNYQSAHRFFPPGNRSGSSAAELGKLSLSWRVHLLPFLGYQNLYRQFQLDEPWDSPHNKQLMAYMPDVFRDEEDSADSTTTRIQVVVAPGSAFPEIGAAPTTQMLQDGMSNTLSYLIAPASSAVPWTKPADYEVDLEKTTFKELRSTDGLVFATFDGAIRRLPPSFETNLLKGLITIDGGEAIDPMQMQMQPR